MNRFEQVRSLGRGTYGAVDLVKQKNDGKLFAIKTIGSETKRMTDEEREAAVREADVLRDLNFLHIVKYFDNWWHGDQLKIVMEYCENGSMRDLLKSRNGEHFKNSRILDLSIQLASALKYIHDHNMVHRDIKPENLLLCRRKRLLKVGDFGIVKVFKHTNSVTNTMKGTPSYMAPEVHKGEDYKYPADVFSVGCIVFELVNLKKAFQVPNGFWYAIGRKIIDGEHQSFERDFCRNFIESCFLLNPEARPNIDEVVEILTETKLDLENDDTDGRDFSKLHTSVHPLHQHHPGNQNSTPSPYLLWINSSSFLSFSYWAKEAFFTKFFDFFIDETQTGNDNSKVELDQASWACLMSNEKFATGHRDGSIATWSKGERLSKKEIHEKIVTQICPLPSGELFTSSKDGTVKVLDSELKVLKEMKGTTRQIDCIANHEHMVAIGIWGGKIFHYNTGSENDQKILTGHHIRVLSLSFRREVLASAGDTTVRLWNPSTSDKPFFTMEHNDWVTSVRFGIKSGSNKLFSCSEDETIKIWDVSSGNEISSIALPGEATCLDVHPTGQLIAVGHRQGVSFIDERNEKIIKEFSGSPEGDNITRDVKFNNSGSKCAVAERLGQTKVIDLRFD